MEHVVCFPDSMQALDNDADLCMTEFLKFLMDQEYTQSST